MATQIEVAKHRLFDEKGLSVPGSDRDATPERMAEQINRAIAQIEAGDYEEIEDLDR